MDIIGVTALRALAPSLRGKGVIVKQVEAPELSTTDFEVNPGSPGQPGSLFMYQSPKGGSASFPNNVGTESTHADQVADNLFGANTGIAPGLQHVGNAQAAYFYDEVIIKQEAVRARVFNQSFELGPHNAAQDQFYDDYIARYNTLVASGIGNSGPVLTPADCYNGMGVAATGSGAASSVGPSADGRCKPDITAPADVTSFSTPYVAGAAALLIQAGHQMGTNLSASVDSRTLKAFLLNGAVKPSDWTHTATIPLDYHYGAGVLNVYNSYLELEAGRHGPTSAALSQAGHPPLTSGSASNLSMGWDFDTVTSNTSDAGVNHYRISTTGTGSLITSLVWNKGYRQTAINQLSLYVYDSGRNLLAASNSTVDNVQQIYLTGLAAGIYEIEVVKTAGRTGAPGVVSVQEEYALVWDFER